MSRHHRVANPRGIRVHVSPQAREGAALGGSRVAKMWTLKRSPNDCCLQTPSTVPDPQRTIIPLPVSVSGPGLVRHLHVGFVVYSWVVLKSQSSTSSYASRIVV